MKHIGRHYFIDGAEIGRGLFEEPKCCLGIATSIISNLQGAKAQKAAADAAAGSQASANAANLNYFNLGRGSGGNAVLPEYLKTAAGTPFESALGQDMVSAYNQTAVGLPNFMAATAPLAPAQAGAVKTTNDIFNGGITQQMQQNNAPVNSARMATARSTSLDSLYKTLDEIDAQQAGRGYVGDSYGGKLLSFAAGNQAGQQIGAANLTNAQSTADINNYGNVTLPLQNLTLPYNMAGQAGAFAFAPQQAYLNSMGARINPFNFMKLGPAAFSTQPLPTRPAAAYDGLGLAVGGAGQAAMSDLSIAAGLVGGGGGGGGGGGTGAPSMSSLGGFAGGQGPVSSWYTDAQQGEGTALMYNIAQGGGVGQAPTAGYNFMGGNPAGIGGYF